MMFLTSETCFVHARRFIQTSGCINSCPEPLKRTKKGPRPTMGEAVVTAMYPNLASHIYIYICHIRMYILHDPSQDAMRLKGLVLWGTPELFRNASLVNTNTFDPNSYANPYENHMDLETIICKSICKSI